MPKTVRLEGDVYTRLEIFRSKRETFSEAVARLLDIQQMAHDIAKALAARPNVHDSPGEKERL